MTRPPQTFAEFWPQYLAAHRCPASRALHYAGTGWAAACPALAAAASPWWLATLPLAYLPAWAGHFLLEGNKPATFGHPFWAAFADFRMFALAATGRLGPHLRALTEPGREQADEAARPARRGPFAA